MGSSVPTRSTGLNGSGPCRISILHQAVAAVVAVSLGLFLKDVSTHGLGAAELERYAAQPYGVTIDAADVSRLHLLWTLGDGQAFVTIAADPLAEGPVRGLDLPAYRMARVGWSLLIRGLALGDIDQLPVAVTLASLGSFAALAMYAVRLVPLWGPRALLVPLTPGVLVGFVQGTAEILGALLLVVAMTAQHTASASVAGVLLGITRPSYATALPGAHRWLPALIGAVASAAILQAVLTNGLGLRTFGMGSGHFDVPFGGYLTAISNSGWTEVVVRNTGIGIILVAALAGYCLDRRVGRGYRLACFATAVLVLCLPAIAVIQPGSYLRVTGGAMILLMMPRPVTEVVDRGETWMRLRKATRSRPL